MMKFNREEGLTLIELLITIAVLAIVAAIAVPVVTNVVNSTDDRAVEQTQSDVEDFVSKYNNTGAFTFDGTGTFEGYVDLNGDGSASADEKIEELVIDTNTFTVAETPGAGTEDDGFANTAPADMASVDYDLDVDADYGVTSASAD